MARTDPRGGQQTRDRIATTASRLFAERGFEGVTVAEVARAAGISSVTVFKYFPKKEDLYFDRSQEAEDLLRATLRDRATSDGTATSLRTLLYRLLDQRHPFSGVDERSVDFFRTVADSPTLLARARQIAADLQNTLARELDDDATGFDGDSDLLAAFFIAGYTRVLSETARELIQGTPHDVLAPRHRQRIDQLIAALEYGVIPSTGPQSD